MNGVMVYLYHHFFSRESIKVSLTHRNHLPSNNLKKVVQQVVPKICFRSGYKELLSSKTTGDRTNSMNKVVSNLLRCFLITRG